MLFYPILILGIVIIAFLLRKRIANLIFGGLLFVALIFFVIFMLDWYTDANIRELTKVDFYDETIKDPEGTLQNISEKVIGTAENINENIKETGEKLDERFGVNQDNQGLWIKKETTEETETETQNESSKKEETTQPVSENKSNNARKGIYTYDEIKKLIQSGNFTEEDQKLINVLTPLNTGTFEGQEIIINTTKEHIEIIRRGQ